MKTFSEYRYFTEAVDLVETDQDEWIVELADVNDDDIIEVIDEDGEVIDELEKIDKKFPSSAKRLIEIEA